MPLGEQAVDGRNGIVGGSMNVDAVGIGLFVGNNSSNVDLLEINVGACNGPTAAQCNGTFVE